ncbi:ParB/RepB/Spo0J family partition protein [Streptomyces sp. NPDC058757]|uniref:ParB/RepB/Spo0J family partition protein n=1 Tax=Streptomyces sp. NPDC058757 TaxID=3346626 RepID=UPI0036C00CF9
MATKKPWADLLDGPGKPGGKRASADASAKAEAPPTTVYMHTLVGNPENPRSNADYCDDDSDFRELKESMKSVGQLQPAVAMSREAFLRVKPEHGQALGDAQWVVILGNRRFHAAKQLGWTKFEIRVRDRLGNDDDDKLDEAVVIENIHRKNIPPYKEAEFLQRMVERHGSQEKVAERIGKSQMYVSNRLALLNLPPELQEAVDTKQLKVKTAEKIAKIQDPEQQKAIAAEELRKAQAPKAPRKRAPAPVGPPVQNPVLNEASGVGGTAAAKRDLSRRDNPLLEDRGHVTDDVPAPRSSAEASSANAPVESPVPDLVAGTTPASGRVATTEVALSDGVALMDLAFNHLSPEQRSAFIQRYFKRSTGVEAVVADLRADLDLPAIAALAEILQKVAAGLLEES